MSTVQLSGTEAELSLTRREGMSEKSNLAAFSHHTETCVALPLMQLNSDVAFLLQLAEFIAFQVIRIPEVTAQDIDIDSYCTSHRA